MSEEPVVAMLAYTNELLTLFPLQAVTRSPLPVNVYTRDRKAEVRP